MNGNGREGGKGSEGGADPRTDDQTMISNWAAMMLQTICGAWRGSICLGHYAIVLSTTLSKRDFQNEPLIVPSVGGKPWRHESDFAVFGVLRFRAAGILAKARHKNGRVHNQKAQTNQENYNNSKWERSEKYCTVMTRNEHHWFVGGNIVVLMI